jgi:homoserine O-acetyltransferase
MSIFHSPVADAHVEAFCSTGSSPGQSVLEQADESTVHVSLALDHHGSRTVSVRFEAQGPVDAAPVLVLGGISASRHAVPPAEDPSRGWWPGIVGNGLAVDPCGHRIIGIDYLGGPGTGWVPSAPLTPVDQARAVLAVLDHLCIARITLLGASYGGMVALAFAEAYPTRVDRAIVLCAAHRPHPMATALRAIQRRIIRLGVAADRSSEGVALARALAMTTYRSVQEFEERFSYAAQGETHVGFPVEAYLAARGSEFSDRFDTEAFFRLSESIDLHDVAPEAVSVPLTLVSVDSDGIAPPWLVQELAAMAPDVRGHTVLSSRFGHDAFLKEVEAVSSILREALPATEVAR